MVVSLVKESMHAMRRLRWFSWGTQLDPVRQGWMNPFLLDVSDLRNVSDEEVPLISSFGVKLEVPYV